MYVALMFLLEKPKQEQFSGLNHSTKILVRSKVAHQEVSALCGADVEWSWGWLKSFKTVLWVVLGPL